MSLISGVSSGGGGGSGDTTGPTSSVDNAAVRFDGTTGKIVQQQSDIKFADSVGSPSTPITLTPRNDSGTTYLALSGGYVYLEGQRIYVGTNASTTLAVREDTNTTTLAGNASLCWTSANNDAVNTAADVGLKRSATNTLRLTDGSTGYGKLELGSGVVLLSGSGTPEGVVSASVGSMYLRTNGGAGTSIYIKESGSGNTGWVAK